MEKEKLIIKNFGPIKSVELDLGRFNILIGEQATGKSTVAKVLAVCRYFSYIVEEDDLPFGKRFQDGLNAWGLKEYTKENSYIFYQCKHYSFEVEFKLAKEYEDVDIAVYEKEYIDFTTKIIPLSKNFKNLLSELEKIQATSNPRWTIPTSFFLNDVKSVLDNPFYLPTERGLQSIFSLGQGSIPNLANFLFNYYSKVDGIFKSFKTETEIEPLDIFYVNRNGIGYIRKKNEPEFYLLANAASGYQSTIPAILAMKYYELQKRKKTFIIEEPELNLFPKAQDKVMQYLVEKVISNDNTILLTTHSPYILTSLNNMMFAYQIGKIDFNKSASIIDKKYWLDPNEVSAYMMKSDGTAENIIDDEVLQIKAEKIDEISRQFNKEYDEMLDVKYPVNNEG